MSAKRKTPKDPLPAVETLDVVDTELGEAAEERPKRLCSEIQLFDLCSKSACDARDGRFCTDEKLLAKFEAISDEEETIHDQYEAGESGEDGEDDFSTYRDDLDEEEDYDDEYDEEP